jgi:hypothetical protein
MEDRKERWRSVPTSGIIHRQLNELIDSSQWKQAASNKQFAFNKQVAFIDTV